VMLEGYNILNVIVLMALVVFNAWFCWRWLTKGFKEEPEGFVDKIMFSCYSFIKRYTRFNSMFNHPELSRRETYGLCLLLLFMVLVPLIAYWFGY
jgi:hypothetical protein